MDLSDGLSLNKWYHLTNTLSDLKNISRYLYIVREWFGFHSIQQVKQKFTLNDVPLHSGRMCSQFSWV
jgi:hypothetical protein